MNSVVLNQSKSRRSSGSYLIELPFSLWILFMGLGFPLIVLATLALRFNFLITVAHDAARAASKATSYAVDMAPDEKSAVGVSNTMALAVAQSFAGVKLTGVHTSIVATDVNTQQSVTQEGPLALPADTSKFLYSIQVAVEAQIDPLITIPGLIGPFNTKVSAKELCENPQGLNQ